MKVAIAHDWFEAVGGAEFVVENLLAIYPDATIWCLWADPDASVRRSTAVHESWMAKMPLRLRRPAALLFGSVYWRFLPRRNYDLVIKSSHLFAHLARFRGNRGASVTYVYSPARYLWFPDIDKRFSSRIVKPILNLLRAVDVRWHSSNLTIAISSEISQRVAKTWGVASNVIYPPLRLSANQSTAQAPMSLPLGPADAFVLAAGRLVDYKRFDLAIEVAELASVPLVIAGAGPSYEQLQILSKQASTPVHFVHKPTDAELHWLFENSKALLFMGVEDFGIVPLEAMSHGTPVVGIDQGGLAETVIDGVTGYLVSSTAAAAEKLFHVSSLNNQEAFRENLLRFSPQHFQTQFAEACAEVLYNSNHGQGAD